jgi:uncharacterized protein (TIGR00255 family)
MSIKSMTGFGSAKSETENYNIFVEISSVNKKNLDIKIGLSKEYLLFENKIIELVKTQIARGAVSLQINIVPGKKCDTGSVEINHNLAKDIVTKFKELSDELQISNDIGTSSLLNIPGVMSITQNSEKCFDELWGLLEKNLLKSFRNLIEMRTKEGENLKADLEGMLTQADEIKKKIDMLAPKAIEEYKLKFLERLAKIEEDIQVDEDRIQQEIALFADKADITEELTRLDSHLKQMKQYLQSNIPVGRPMDFLCQEILREINTIGSKANNLEITKNVLDEKAILESFREQIQNVE